MPFGLKNRLIVGLIWLLLGAQGVLAQDVEVEVRTNARVGWVRVDSLVRIPLAHGKARIPLSPGPHHIQLLPPDMDSWLFVRPETLLVITARGPSSIYLPFPYIYRVETIPPGARVVYNGHLLGYTTLYHVSRKPLEGVLLLEKKGYYPATLMLSPTDSLYIRRRVSLIPQAQPPAPWWKKPELDYVALGVAFVGTLVSIHYKFQADALYDRYLQTGEPELKPRIRRYDRYAGWALAVGQAGLILFGIRLLLR